MNPGRGAGGDGKDDSNRRCATPAPDAALSLSPAHSTTSVPPLVTYRSLWEQRVSHWLTLAPLPRPPPPLLPLDRVSFLRLLIAHLPIKLQPRPTRHHAPRIPPWGGGEDFSPHQIAHVSHWLEESSRLREVVLRLANQTQSGLSSGLRTEWNERRRS